MALPLLERVCDSRISRPPGSVIYTPADGAREPASRLRPVVVGDERYLTLYGGEAVRRDGEVVGRVRSCGYD